MVIIAGIGKEWKERRRMEGNEEIRKDGVELGRVVKDSFNLLSGQLYLNRDKASPTQMKRGE